MEKVIIFTSFKNLLGIKKNPVKPKKAPSSLFWICCEDWDRTSDLRVMLTTTVFTAPAIGGICSLDCTFIHFTGCPITSLYTCNAFWQNSARYYHH